LRVSAAGDDPLLALALAHGVGHIAFATAHPSLLGFVRPSVARKFRLLAPTIAHGVGQRFFLAISASVGRLFELPGDVLKRPEPASIATGVGKNPDSLSQMGSAGVRRRNDSPLRIEPHRGQVSKNRSQSSRSEHW
jgi:hypothetical protein